MAPVSPTVGRFASIFIEENLGTAVNVSTAQPAQPEPHLAIPAWHCMCNTSHFCPLAACSVCACRRSVRR